MLVLELYKSDVPENKAAWVQVCGPDAEVDEL